jgi:hypothetical protein
MMFNNIYECPFCGFEFTHHGRIEIFERNEDDKYPNHITVDKYNVTIDRNNEGNPSTRRDGISIQFWCEQCNRIHYLNIAQHKGNTTIEIVDKGELQHEF